jgi:hypothetical protein
MAKRNPNGIAEPTADAMAALVATNMELMRKVGMLQTRLGEFERNAQPKQYLPLKQAASLAGVSYDVARVWHGKGLIDSYRDAGRIYATVISLIERRARSKRE